MKTCKGCGETKPLTEYYSFRKKRDDFRWLYYATLCKPCHNNQVITRRREKERLDPFEKSLRLLRDIKNKCLKSGLPFDLDEEWIRSRKESGVCEVTGIPFDDGDGSINQRPWGFSVDRIDQTGGYTKDNVKAVVWAYNRAKGVGTHDDVIRLAEAICQATR